MGKITGNLWILIALLIGLTFIYLNLLHLTSFTENSAGNNPPKRQFQRGLSNGILKRLTASTTRQHRRFFDVN